MARGNARSYLGGDRVRLKKYLYVLRPLLATCWVEQGRGPAPMRFETLVETLIDEPALRAAIDDLLRCKRVVDEAEHGAPSPVLTAFIARELTRLEAVVLPTAPPIEMMALDQLLYETVCQGSVPGC